MTSETHSLFDSVFINTHSELSSLREQMEEFQIIYQSNETVTPFTNNESPLINVLIKPNEPNEPNESNEPNEPSLNDESGLNDESSLNEPILNDEQINKFRKIYLKNKIADVDENDDDNSTQKLKNKLNKKDGEALIKKLQTEMCCKKKCL